MLGKQLVISDASPLIALSLVGQLPLLHALFGQVLVSPIVIQEVLTGQFDRGEAEIRAAFDEGWLSLCTAQEAVIDLMGLDPGEKQSIMQAVTLMGEGRVPLLLMDELAGRAAAAEYQLQCLGTGGLIAFAKRKGLIPSAKDVLQELLQREFRISKAVIRKVLIGAGESLD
jgi:uncharacterized protein